MNIKHKCMYSDTAPTGIKKIKKYFQGKCMYSIINSSSIT